MKEMERFFRILSKYNETISRVVGSSKKYESRLEEICEADQNSIAALIDIGKDVVDCFGVPEKFAGFNVDEFLPRMSYRLERIDSLTNAFLHSLNYVINDIESRWKRSSQKLNEWEPKYGFDDLVNSREELNNIVGLYKQVFTGIGFEQKMLTKLRNQEIELYSQFVDDVHILDLKFEQLNARYETLKANRLGKSDAHVLHRDVLELNELYNKVVNSYLPLYKRIARSDSIFYYKERFMELKAFERVLIMRSAKTSRSSKWKDYYKNNLDYLAGSQDIDFNHVKRVASIELVDTVSYPTANADLSGLVEKTTAAVENELSRIKQTLDKRAKLIEGFYQKDVEKGNFSRLGSMVNKLDSDAEMYKLIDADTHFVSNLRAKIMGYIEFRHNVKYEQHSKVVRI